MMSGRDLYALRRPEEAGNLGIKPFRARIVPLLAIALLGSGTVVVAADWFYLTTIPLLSVANPGDKPIGAPSYAIIQVAHLSQPLGLEVLFNEGARGLGAFQGSVFGADWKEAAEGLNVKVVEVPTIIEAYERMIGKGVP